MLDEQGQQLDRVEGNLNTINAEMKQAEKTLSKMEKWCGLFTCPWNRYLSDIRIEVTKTFWLDQRNVMTGPDDSVWVERGGQRSAEGSGAQQGGSRDTMDTAQPGGPYVQT